MLARTSCVGRTARRRCAVRDDRGGRWAAGTACVRVRRAADHVYTELSEPPATVVQHVSSGAGEHRVRSVATNKLV